MKVGDIPGGEIQQINVGQRSRDTQKFQTHWQGRFVEIWEFQNRKALKAPNRDEQPHALERAIGSHSDGQSAPHAH